MDEIKIEQIINEIVVEQVGGNGNDGKSAYEVAVSNGFIGTQSEWLESLKGADGNNGQAATISIGTTTTGAAGTSASVTNSGTSQNVVLNFTIPKGADGNDGQAATISIGTTTTGAAGTSASVTNSGTSQNAILNFTIPKGDTGSGGGSSNFNFDSTNYNILGGNYTITGGSQNTILSSGVGNTNINGSENILIGYKTGLSQYTGAGNNVLIGDFSGQYSPLNYCFSLGHNTLQRGADNNIAIGYYALNNVNTQNNIAIGQYALSYQRYSNCIGIGYGVTVTGDNQVQLGDSSTTTYVYGTVQNRSDERDKADIQECEHGLDFILELKPKSWKWNFREDYKIRTINENNEIVITKIDNDGSKKRKRFHHGFIAQDVKKIIDYSGKDFGGFQNHQINDGDDVMSIGYNEFIAPIVKAIQQQQDIINELKNRISILENKI